MYYYFLPVPSSSVFVSLFDPTVPVLLTIIALLTAIALLTIIIHPSFADLPYAQSVTVLTVAAPGHSPDASRQGVQEIEMEEATMKITRIAMALAVCALALSASGGDLTVNDLEEGFAGIATDLAKAPPLLNDIVVVSDSRPVPPSARIPAASATASVPPSQTASAATATPSPWIATFAATAVDVAVAVRFPEL